MITPKFSCTQDDSSLTIQCYVPAVRASEVEIAVADTQFTLHINPYFLRLSFSGNLIEDDASSAEYNPSTGYLTVKLTKETKGEVFKDLDLLAKLLAPKVRDEEDLHPTIEVIDDDKPSLESITSDPVDELTSATAELNVDSERQVLLEAEKHGWNYPQEPPETRPELVTSEKKPYGFLDAYSGYFEHVAYTSNEVNELGADAERLTPTERKQRREAHENEKWDEEYYLADFVNDEDIQEHIHWHSPYKSPQTPVEFTEDENAAMLRLPRKEYLPTPNQTRTLYLTLFNILFSYAYDLRTTQADPTPESAWTIATLTPAFSALDTSSTSSLSATIIASYRRALAFPLYRNWDLCKTCQRDVADILQLGRRGVTRALLQTKKILDKHEVYYIYSKIWVNDYIVWVQSYATDEALLKLSTDLRKHQPSKSSMRWSLDDLEEATQGLEADSDDESEPDNTSSRPTPL